MKHLILLLFSISMFSQSVADPRLRVSRQASMVLSTTWQALVFNGSESQDINTFGIDPASGLKMCSYDPVTKLFKYNGGYDTNLFTSFQFTTTTTLITTKATLQIRFVIPNGVSAGVDFIFPFTANGGYADINDITLKTSAINNMPFDFCIYTNQALRTNGFRVELRLSNNLTAVSTLNYASMRIQGISKN